MRALTAQLGKEREAVPVGATAMRIAALLALLSAGTTAADRLPARQRVAAAGQAGASAAATATASMTAGGAGVCVAHATSQVVRRVGGRTIVRRATKTVRGEAGSCRADASASASQPASSKVLPAKPR